MLRRPPRGDAGARAGPRPRRSHACSSADSPPRRAPFRRRGNRLNRSPKIESRTQDVRPACRSRAGEVPSFRSLRELPRHPPPLPPRPRLRLLLLLGVGPGPPERTSPGAPRTHRPCGAARGRGAPAAAAPGSWRPRPPCGGTSRPPAARRAAASAAPRAAGRAEPRGAPPRGGASAAPQPRLGGRGQRYGGVVGTLLPRPQSPGSAAFSRVHEADGGISEKVGNREVAVTCLPRTVPLYGETAGMFRGSHPK